MSADALHGRAPEPLPWLAGPLARALSAARAEAGGRAHHALLVHGSPGTGELEMAMALAAAWLCEAPGPDGTACGRCTGCRLVHERAHPDLRLLVPDARREAAGLPPEASPRAAPAAGSQAGMEIRVDAVREAIAFSALTPSRAREKVMVIWPADALGVVAANALLKTLEEPPGPMRFVLATARPAVLLPTLRSRCQAVALELPGRAQALAWLQGQGVQDAGEVLDACGGEPLTARDLALREGLVAAVWRALPGQVEQGRADEFAGWPLPRLIDALQRLCHDRLMAHLGLPPRYFTGQPPAPAPAQAVAEATRWLRGHARHARHPWQAALAVQALVQGTRARLAASPTPIHPPTESRRS